MKIFLPILFFICIAGRSQTAGDIVYGSDQVIYFLVTDKSQAIKLMKF